MEALFYGLPTLCTLLSYYIKRGFPLTDDLMTLIRDGCALHMQGRPARDPVTGRIHRRPSYAGDEKLLRNAVWKLENFSTTHLEWLVNDLSAPSESSGRQKLITEMKKVTNCWIATAILSLAVTIFSLLTDLIHSQTTSWIPSFSVVIFSLSVMFTIINKHRSKTAEQLLEVPVIWSDCKYILKEFIIHRTGVSSKFAHDEGWFKQSLEAVDRKQFDGVANPVVPPVEREMVEYSMKKSERDQQNGAHTPPSRQTEFGRYQPETSSYVQNFDENQFSYPDEVIPPLTFDTPTRGRGSRLRLPTQFHRESPFESHTRLNKSPSMYDRQTPSSRTHQQRDPPYRSQRSRSKQQESIVEVLH